MPDLELIRAIGKRLNLAREWSGLSLRAVEEALRDDFTVELSHASIGRVEQGLQVLRLDQFIAICGVYRARPTWILTGEMPRQLPDESPPAEVMIRKVLFSEALLRDLRKALEATTAAAAEREAGEAETEDEGSSEDEGGSAGLKAV